MRFIREMLRRRIRNLEEETRRALLRFAKPIYIGNVFELKQWVAANLPEAQQHLLDAVTTNLEQEAARPAWGTDFRYYLADFDEVVKHARI